MDHSIIETALVQKFQLYSDIEGQERLGAGDDRRDEQMIPVEEPDPDRLCGESGSPPPQHREAIEPSGHERPADRIPARDGSSGSAQSAIDVTIRTSRRVI